MSLVRECANLVIFSKHVYKEMEQAIVAIRTNRMDKPFDIVKILMEQAECTKATGIEKKRAVLEAYVKLSTEDGGQQRYNLLPLNNIELIIDSFVYMTKTHIAVNMQDSSLFRQIWDSILLYLFGSNIS